MTLDRADLERRLPHAGTMLLLDMVTQWDATHVVCVAASPTAAHPLWRDGAVSSVAACEYAAQAAAIHGALLGGEHAVPGMLAKLDGVDLHAAQIPKDGGSLTVTARRLASSDRGCRYTFAVTCAGQEIASGRLMVAFTPPVEA